MSVVEKIKQLEYYVETFKKTEEKWVKLDVALSIINGYNRELAELLENRPERCYKECKCCQRFDEWVGVLKEKFAELTKES